MINIGWNDNVNLISYHHIILQQISYVISIKLYISVHYKCKTINVNIKLCTEETKIMNVCCFSQF